MNKIITMCLIFSILVFCCNLSTGTYQPDQPDVINMTISGTVIDKTTLQPVPSAEVSAGNSSITADADGIFTLDISSASEGIQLMTSCEGFVSTQKPMVIEEDQNLIVEIKLLPAAPPVRIDPAVENTITFTPDGASVTIPAIAAITEPLDVSVTYIDAGTSDLSAAPGNFEGIDENGDECSLESRGMIDVNITGADTGNVYSLDGLGTYSIEIPVNPVFDDSGEGDGTTIPLWYFDTQSGMWIEEGTAVKNGNVYQGNVNHFSVWNADFKWTNTAEIYGEIQDPLPSATDETYKISLIGEGFFRAYIQDINDLSFSVFNLPVLTDMTVSVTKMSTMDVWSKEIITGAAGTTTDIGAFPDGTYYSNVKKFLVNRDSSAIYVSWTNPVHALLENVVLTILNTNTGTTIVETFSSGEEAYSFTPDEGVNIFSIQTTFSDGNVSTELSDTLHFYIYYTFSISEVINNRVDPPISVPPEDVMYIMLDGASSGFYYTTPINLAYNTPLLIEARLEDLVPGNFYICTWYIDGDFFPNYDENLEVTMDDDYDISFHYTTCN